MKIMNSIHQNISRKGTVFGLASSYGYSPIIEKMCKGWDFVWIDVQHGQHTYSTVLHSLQASLAISIDAIIRVPENSYGTIGKYSDLAPAAMMFPMVNTSKEAETIVNYIKFSPEGSRSFGGRRMIDLYGREGYNLEVNRIFTIAQIETEIALMNCERIAETKGIDMIFFGADDIRLNMGLLMESSVLENEKLYAAFKKVAIDAKQAGKFCGCVATNEELISEARRVGYNLVVCGSDSMFLSEGSQNQLNILNKII